ncbi:MAG: HlyC/CorC family transporter [Acidobacteria bacterium]|nr:HlyC/CorC family transporter [Acidobacteriota bacterium]
MSDAALDVGLRLLGVVALVFANGFFVAAEFSLVTVRKTRLDQLIAEGNRQARVVREAVGDPDRYIAATQLGITMASLGLGWIGEPAVAATMEPAFAFLPRTISTVTAHTISVTLAFALITALHIIFGELAPKTIALQHAEKTALFVVRPTKWFLWTFRPFILLLNGMGRAAAGALGLKPPSGYSLVHSEEELKMLVTASQEAGVLEEYEEQMLHRVFGFGDLTAGQVMLPRTELSALPAGASLKEVIDEVARAPHPWLPVYREGLDDIAGIVHAKDLFPALSRPADEFRVLDFVQEALTVPETMKADDLLIEMRRRATHHAIVIDEYGGTAGLVTFDRLMERIIGGIDGEPGSPGRIATLADGSVLIDGLALTTDINERFGLHLDEETYNTLGGYVLGRLGRRARLGDCIELEGHTLRVEALDGLRVARVHLSAPGQSGRSGFRV